MIDSFYVETIFNENSWDSEYVDSKKSNKFKNVVPKIRAHGFIHKIVYILLDQQVDWSQQIHHV